MRVVLLVGIALTLMVQVFANSGVAGMVLQWYTLLSDKLTISPEIMNSTDSAFHDDFHINRFLAPDSKVASTLQGSLQKFKELETAPSCNKLASAALIYTCATSEDDKEASESTEDTLTGEKILFAARLAVCELSDSAHRSLVPAECASFVLTMSNTKQKGWFAYYSAKGREKSVPRYPEYDQATRQNRDRCVAALQDSPVTHISYSNAKQTAHQWCSIARVDIENEKLLQSHRAFTENLVHQDDVLRAHAEALHQHMEATQFLGNQLRAFAQNTMETYDAFREVLMDARETVHNLVEDMGVQLQAKLEQAMAAHDVQDARIRAKIDKFISEIVDVTAQQSTELSLARRNDAEELSGRLSYAVELIEQRMMQLSSDESNKLEILQLVKHELAGAYEGVYILAEGINNMTDKMQHMQNQQEDLSTKLENSGKIAANLESQLSTVSGIVSFFTGISDRIGYLIGAGILLLFLALGGRPILTLAIASTLKLFWITFHKLKELAQLVLLVAGNFLSSTMSAAQQWVDWKGALLLISSVAGIAMYSLVVETPTAYWQRWENGELSLFEPVNIAAIGMIVIVFLCAISSRALAFRESGLLQAGEYESYDEKECAV